MRKLKTYRPIRLALFACLLFIGCNGSPYNDPHKTGYNFKDDARPWFDGKDYPYYREMFDGKGIKPQEEGTYQDFPTDSVPVKMELGRLQKIYEPFVALGPDRETYPQNPTVGTPDSVERGTVLFNTYCAACHGRDGMANTPVVQKGMPAPPIAGLRDALTESHIYNKIRYGSAYMTSTMQLIPGMMPPYGVQTSIQDRWDIVNYLKSPQFGKEMN